jgi:hypothetical protein
MTIKQKFATSTKAQCRRLLKALQEAGPKGITTIEAREDLDIMMPATRIHELRHKQGINIQTIEVKDVTAQGHPHRCSRYVLLPGKWKGDQAA